MCTCVCKRKCGHGHWHVHVSAMTPTGVCGHMCVATLTKWGLVYSSFMMIAYMHERGEFKSMHRITNLCLFCFQEQQLDGICPERDSREKSLVSTLSCYFCEGCYYCHAHKHNHAHACMYTWLASCALVHSDIMSRLPYVHVFKIISRRLCVHENTYPHTHTGDLVHACVCRSAWLCLLMYIRINLDHALTHTLHEHVHAHMATRS